MKHWNVKFFINEWKMLFQVLTSFCRDHSASLVPITLAGSVWAWVLHQCILVAWAWKITGLLGGSCALQFRLMENWLNSGLAEGAFISSGGHRFSHLGSWFRRCILRFGISLFFMGGSTDLSYSLLCWSQTGFDTQLIVLAPFKLSDF
jgi:hypothetical protein